MTRVIHLQLGEFGKQSLGRLLDGGEGSPDSAVRTAVLYYLDDRCSGRPAWRAPRLGSAKAGETVEVSFDEATWRALESEARKQETTPEWLAAHAFQYYLGDLDSGRLGARLDETLDQDEPPGAT